MMPVNPREPKPRTKIMVRVIGNETLEVWTTDAAIFVRAKMDAMRFGKIQAGTQVMTDSSTMLTVLLNPCYNPNEVAFWIARGGVFVDAEGEQRKVNDDATPE